MGMLDRLKIYRAIETLLSSPDAATPEYAQAVVRLKQIGRPAVPRLIQALGRATSPDIVIDLLITFLDNASLPIFCQELANQDTRVVKGVVNVLSRGDRYDPNRLLDLLADARVPNARLVPILTAHKDSIKPKALLELLHVVGKGSQGAVFQLIDEVANVSILPDLLPYIEHQDWLVRLHIARTLSKFKTEAVRDALMSLLNDQHKNVRQVALEGLANLELDVSVGPVCQLLRDPDLTVQSKAIETLIRLNDAKAIHHLLDVLQDESEYVRRAAVEVLNAVGNTDAIKDLLGALRDKDWWVRVRAADALGNIGGARVVEAILPLIKDEDEFIRRCAVEILNTTKDERAFEYLVSALEDGDWWVQERAIDALANLGDTRAVPALVRLLKADTQATAAAIRALVALGDGRAVHPLLAKLKSQDKAVRRETIRALGSLAGEGEAEEAQSAIMQAMVDLDDQSKELAQEVVHKLASRFSNRMATMAEAVPGSATLLREVSELPAQPHPNYVTSLIESPSERTSDSVVATPDSSPVGQFIDPMALTAGDVLAERYRVIRIVGRGAFGVVVLVDDMAVKEEIILKFLNPHLAANRHIIKRFIQELRFARRITHENVIRIYDFVTIGKSYTISMEYFPSYPLSQEMQRGCAQISSRRLKIMSDICSGMAVAHQATIVHRDLKPQNILVNDDGLVKIVDFGLAAAISHDESRLTGSGALMGTPTYMSPEQVQGRDVDARTDIYSLGVIMYEMFAGKPPYQGKDPISILYQHVQGDVIPPRKINVKLPPELEKIILTAMSVEPDDRYQDIVTMQACLDAVLEREMVNGTP